jgi:hypothetical protein
MPFDIEFTQAAADHVRGYKKFEQKIIFDAIDELLTHQPTVETKNKNPWAVTNLPIGSCVCRNSACSMM